MRGEVEFDEPVLGSARPRTGLKNSNSVSGISNTKAPPTRIARPGSSNGRAGGFESGIPRPGLKKATHENGNINISIASTATVPVNFTNSNAAQVPNARSGFDSFDQYEVPERVPFSSTTFPPVDYSAPPDSEREVNQLVDLLN